MAVLPCSPALLDLACSGLLASALDDLVSLVAVAAFSFGTVAFTAAACALALAGTAASTFLIVSAAFANCVVDCEVVLWPEIANPAPITTPAAIISFEVLSIIDPPEGYIIRKRKLKISYKILML